MTIQERNVHKLYNTINNGALFLEISNCFESFTDSQRDAYKKHLPVYQRKAWGIKAEKDRRKREKIEQEEKRLFEIKEQERKIKVKEEKARVRAIMDAKKRGILQSEILKELGIKRDLNKDPDYYFNKKREFNSLISKFNAFMRVGYVLTEEEKKDLTEKYYTLVLISENLSDFLHTDVEKTELKNRFNIIIF